jgi:hypothetical protein
MINHSCLAFQYEDAGRPEIINSLIAVVKRYIAGEKITGLQVAPRVGKQSIVVLVANEARAQGAPFVHCTVPWTNLCYQIVDENRNQKTFDFYKAYGTVEPFRADIVETIPHHKYYCSYRQSQSLLCSTVQLLHANIGTVVEAVKYAIKSTGKRPVFIIDEAQLMGEGQSWYEMTERLIDAGAYIVSMTGTERRIDKKPIVGFQYTKAPDVEEESFAFSQIKEVKKNDNGEKIASVASGTMKTTEYIVKPIGSEPVPIRRAFEKGWCESMDVKTFDFEVMDIATGDKFKISEASLEKTRPNLIKWLMSDECVKVAAKHVLDDFVRRRVELGLSEAKAMFVTLSDVEHVKKKGDKEMDENANYHARKIRKEFLSQLAELPIQVRAHLGRVNAEICTSALSDGGPDKASMEKLRRFALTEMDDKGIEPIDVIFVKNMGVVGLDVPQLKTMANLSNNSADAPTTLQANLRIATKWPKSEVPALLVLPAHYHGRKFRDMCGKWSNKIRVSVFEEDGVSEKVIQDRQKELLEVVNGSGKVHSYSTHDGFVIQEDMEATVIAVRVKYKAANLLSYYQLIETIKQGAFPLSDQERQEAVSADQGDEGVKSSAGVQVVNTSKQRHDAESGESYGSKLQRLTGRIVHYSSEPERWKDARRRIDDCAKMICGVRYQKKKDIIDPQVHADLFAALDDAYVIVQDEFNGVVA